MPVGEWLVDALVARLRPVVPEGFVIESAGGSGVEVHNINAFPLSHIQLVEEIINQDGDPTEHVQDAAHSVLDGVQDFIAEMLTEPWPGERTMPVPFVHVRDGFLHTGFGDEDTPVIRFDPIPLPT